MHKFEVKKCDVMTQHNPDYFHRQEKNRDWLLMCFQTPFQYYKDGKMIEGKPGDCLLNSPDKYIEHGPTEKMSVGFQNDWMYFDGEDIEDAIFNYGIPIDIHFSIGDPSFMTQGLQTIMYENLNKQHFYKEKISCVAENMFLDLSRSILCENQPSQKIDNIFKQFRTKMFNSIEEDWTLENMASQTRYSVSRFCSLYKKSFGISPTSDLIMMRVQKAKTLLSCSAFSVNEIAFKTGFSSVHHFSYTFKKYVGVSPVAYRKSNDFFA